jgi:MFS family permease
MPRRSPLAAIFLVVLVDVLGLTIMLPLLPLYAERFGASAFVASLLQTTYALCSLISGPILGQISDRVGRKPLLAVSQVGTLLGFLLLAEAPSLWLVFVARVIDGLTAGNLSLAQAYISDVTSAENRAKSFALIGIAFGVGFFIGPFASGWVAHELGLRAPIYLAAALSALSICATVFLLPAAPPHAAPAAGEPAGRRVSIFAFGTYAQYFRRPVLGRLLLEFFAFAFAFTTFTSGFPLFAERRLVWDGRAFGSREIGWAYAYSGFVGIILQGGLIGRLIKRFGEPRLVRLSWVLSVVGYALLALPTHMAPLLAVATVITLGHGSCRPTLTSQISQHADRAEQGVVLGLTQSLNALAATLSPILGGWLLDAGQLSLWTRVSAVAAAVGLALALVGRERERAAQAA